MNTLIRTSLAAAFAVSAATFASASAATINFEGVSGLGDYTAIGVTFQGTDDGSIIGGIGNGDPGNWDLEGTNGSQFSGYNGASYSMTVLFDYDLSSFSMDASRSNGSSAGNSITLEAYNNGILVDSVSAVFGDINDWLTLSIASVVFDEVRWFGVGEGFHPFGVDNLVFAATSEIPLPAALPLFLAGLGALGVSGARRRRKAA